MPILYARFIWGLCLSGGQVVPCGIEGKDRRERVVSPIMLDKLVHNRWPRVGAALFGSLLLALAINLFIVPQHLAHAAQRGPALPAAQKLHFALFRGVAHRKFYHKAAPMS